MECSERFLRRNALEGYDAHAQAGVLAIRSDLEAGRADVPAADIVAAEIKQVGLIGHAVALGEGLRDCGGMIDPTPYGANWYICCGCVYHPPRACMRLTANAGGVAGGDALR